METRDMIGVIAICFVFFGGGGFFLGLWAAFKFTEEELKQARANQNIDYKQRWLEAVQLLQDEGRITEAQLKKITGEKSHAEKSADLLADLQARHITASPSELKEIRKMSSWDRCEVEVDRAKKGLPPLDDLKGMSSWDKTEVLKARAKYSDRQQQKAS